MTVVHMWFGNKIVLGVLKREVNDDASEAAILKFIKLGEDTESPKLGEDTESPKLGEDTESPKLVEDTESPKLVSSKWLESKVMILCANRGQRQNPVGED